MELMAKPIHCVPLHHSARIQQRQTSCLDGLQSTLKEDELNFDCGGHNTDHELWCICQVHDESCLMLCCDRQGEGCYIWYHYDCLGLTKEEGQQIGTSGEDFICPSCSHLAQDNLHDAPFIARSLY